MAMHPEQLDVTVDVVRALVDQQFPQWTDLPVRALPARGTVNALFRLGDMLVARFPLVPADVDDVLQSLRAEATAARELVGTTRFATPEPVALGVPGPGYQLPWAVQTWVHGTAAWDVADALSTDFAGDLAEFITGVRAIPVGDRTFNGSGRGGDLPDHDEWVQTCLQRSHGLLDVAALSRVWAGMRDLPPSPGPDQMNHGDLIPGNVLVDDRRLVGVIDVGGLGPADPALDLVAAWHLLDETPRRVLRSELKCDDLEWARGAAWAFEQAIGLVWYYLDSNPAMSAMGRRTLGRIMTDAPPTS